MQEENANTLEILANGENQANHCLELNRESNDVAMSESNNTKRSLSDDAPSKKRSRYLSTEEKEQYKKSSLHKRLVAVFESYRPSAENTATSNLDDAQTLAQQQASKTLAAPVNTIQTLIGYMEDYVEWCAMNSFDDSSVNEERMLIYIRQVTLRESKKRAMWPTIPSSSEEYFEQIRMSTKSVQGHMSGVMRLRNCQLEMSKKPAISRPKAMIAHLDLVKKYWERKSVQENVEDTALHTEAPIIADRLENLSAALGATNSMLGTVVKDVNTLSKSIDETFQNQNRILRKVSEILITLGKQISDHLNGSDLNEDLPEKNKTLLDVNRNVNKNLLKTSKTVASNSVDKSSTSSRNSSYKMNRNITSVSDLWEEYYIGSRDISNIENKRFPSIMALEAERGQSHSTKGDSWRGLNKSGDSKYYLRRLPIYQCISNLAETLGRDHSEMATVIECLRQALGLSLQGLGDRLGKAYGIYQTRKDVQYSKFLFEHLILESPDRKSKLQSIFTDNKFV